MNCVCGHGALYLVLVLARKWKRENIINSIQFYRHSVKMLYFCDSLNEKLILIFLKIRLFQFSSEEKFYQSEKSWIWSTNYCSLVHKLLLIDLLLSWFILFFSNSCFILYAQPIRYAQPMSVIPDGFYFYLLLYQFSTQIGFTTFVNFYLRPTLLKIINS